MGTWERAKCVTDFDVHRGRPSWWKVYNRKEGQYTGILWHLTGASASLVKETWHWPIDVWSQPSNLAQSVQPDTLNPHQLHLFYLVVRRER